MNSLKQHLTTYKSGSKKIFIYDLDEDTSKYNIHESLKYKGNYSITMNEFILAVKLYEKIIHDINYSFDPDYIYEMNLNCKKTLRVIYMTYWLETFRVKQRFYLEKWGAGMDFGKTIDSFCNILSRFCDGYKFSDYEYYLNLSKSFEKKDFIPKELLKNLMFKFVSDDYSSDVFLDDIVSENGRLVAKKPFIKKYKKKFEEMGMEVKTIRFASQLESYIYSLKHDDNIYNNYGTTWGSGMHDADEREEYEFLDEEEVILITAS